MFLQNPRAVQFQLKCVIDEGPCDRIGKYLKGKHYVIVTVFYFNSWNEQCHRFLVYNLNKFWVIYFSLKSTFNENESSAQLMIKMNSTYNIIDANQFFLLTIPVQWPFLSSSRTNAETAAQTNVDRPVVSLPSCSRTTRRSGLRLSRNSRWVRRGVSTNPNYANMLLNLFVSEELFKYCKC